MPYNHFLPRTYFRGFTTKLDCVNRWKFNGSLLDKEIKTDRIGGEHAPKEPEIENLRTALENFWGKIRSQDLKLIHKNEFKGRKDRIISFVSLGFYLSKLGRNILRKDRKEYTPRETRGLSNRRSP